MKNSAFRSNKKFFHSSLNFQTQNLFKNLEWIFVQKKLAASCSQYNIELQALVMMDTHIHILFAGFEQQENFFCESLQKNLSDNYEAGDISEPILNYSQYLNTYKYIYRNAVEARLCDLVQDYPYSSLPQLLGHAIPYCQVYDQLGLIQNPLHILKWLNTEMNYKVSQIKLLNQYKVFAPR